MLFAVLFSLAIAGQSAEVPRDCRDDNGTDRCAAENRAAVLRSLGMRPIEEELAAGTEVYRTFQVDGYGNVMAGLAYERSRGSSPQVVIYGAEGARMTAPVSPTDWRSVQSEAALVQRDLAPLPNDPNSFGFCLHAWVSTVEIANAAERGVPKSEVRRRTQSGCGDGLASRFAFDLAARAIKAFPDCDALDPDDHRNDASRLRTCVGFRGDRLAVAELLNAVGRDVVPEQAADTQLAWMRSFGGSGDVKLDWAGRRIEGGNRHGNNPVAAFMVEQMALHPSLYGVLSSFDGVTSTRVEATGWLSMDGADDQRLNTTFRQTWLWDRNGLNWKLDSWTVEPFAAPAR